MSRAPWQRLTSMPSSGPPGRHMPELCRVEIPSTSRPAPIARTGPRRARCRALATALPDRRPLKMATRGHRVEQRRRAQRAPALMYSVWPLTYKASSDARKTQPAKLHQETVVIDISAAGELLTWCGQHSYSKNGTWRWSVTNYESKGPRRSERRTRSEPCPMDWCGWRPPLLLVVRRSRSVGPEGRRGESYRGQVYCPDRSESDCCSPVGLVVGAGA